jgi:NAD(P)-dependent dehydrogenase (short-subunit alcohol dehydrogenase family)
MTFAGKVALITGGGSGMGRTAAQRLAQQGAGVAILDVNEQGMAETAAAHDGIRAFNVDVTDSDTVHGTVEQVEREMGPIGRVCNAAAIMPFGKLLEQDPKVQLRLMQINYGGLVNIATSTLPRMIERGAGDFVSFSSMSGVIPGLLMGGYCATKAAVQMYTEILYHENRRSGVRFVCACPPPVATPLWKQAEATVMPRLVEGGDVLTPEQVLDDIERCLEQGEFLSMPGKGTRFGYLMRRFLPGQIWKHTHKVEGF